MIETQLLLLVQWLLIVSSTVNWKIGMPEILLSPNDIIFSSPPGLWTLTQQMFAIKFKNGQSSMLT